MEQSLVKFYQTGTFTVGNRLLAPEQRSVQAGPGRSNSLNSGHRACQGCGEALGARYAIDAAMAATNGQLIAANATGCLEVFSTPYPETSWQMPWIHSLFGNAAAVATGIAAAMKAKGERATYATTANSGVIMGALYKQLAGLQAVEVKYKTGTEALKEMESGAVDYALHDPQVAMQEARKGTIRLLAAATAERLSSVPDVPSMNELGYPMDLQGWFAAMVPMETPDDIVLTINKWFNTVLATEDAKEFLTKFGGEPWISTPEVGQARLVKDVRDWGPYVAAAGLVPQ